MVTALDLARQTVNAAKQSYYRRNSLGVMTTWCMQLVGNIWETYFGRLTPDSFATATRGYRASAIVSLDHAAAPPGAIHWFKQNHVGFGIGGGRMVSATTRSSTALESLGKSVYVHDVASYPLTYLGWSRAAGSKRETLIGKIDGLPAPTPKPTPAGTKFVNVKGDKITYAEPRGELANRILRGLAARGFLDSKKNSISDGIIGINTRKAIQKLLKAEGYYKGIIDGKLGINNLKQIQMLARAKGGYTNVIDGKLYTESWTGLARALGQ